MMNFLPVGSHFRSLLLCGLLATGSLTAVTLPFEAQEPAIQTVILERGECFGTCPVDRVIIRSDGSVVYEGQENVEMLGRFEGGLPDSAFSALQEFILSSDLLKLPENHIAAMDLPVLRTTIVWDGGEKTFSNHGRVGVEVVEGPPGLLLLQDRILRLVSETRWEAG